MSITHELREYANTRISPNKGMLTAIADRIDAEHEKAMAAAALIAGVPMTDENMAELGWIRLPKDADSEHIRIGDVMEGEKVGGGFCEPFEVVGYIMSNGELEPMDEHKCPRKRRYLRHHRTPTVEDVLREFTDAILEWSRKSGSVAEVGTWSDVAAEYAAKLQLKEDE